MKTLFAQAATFAFSAVGALAILVGVIDQPHVLASGLGSVATSHVMAAATPPAVSPLA